MNRKHLLKLATVALLGLVVVALSSAALAQVKAEGLIKGRNGEQIILQTTDNPNMEIDRIDALCGRPFIWFSTGIVTNFSTSSAACPGHNVMT